jgi:adenylyltransferase/sulfurtransferase
LRPYTDQNGEVLVQGSDVGESLKDLVSRYPALRPHLYSDGGELRPFVNVFLNDEDIRHLKGVETPVTESDRLMIIPSIAGGSD